MNELKVLDDRLKKIGIDVLFAGNYPWVYLDQVCGQRVEEKFMANHGFTVGFLQMDGSFKFTDTREIFKILKNMECELIDYGAEEKRCKKCNYITFNARNKTDIETIDQMIRDGYPLPKCRKYSSNISTNDISLK